MAQDLYNEILDTRVPNHYEFLGLKFFESNAEVIHQAGIMQMKKLKAWDLHEDVNTAAKIKEMHIQLSRAIAELENPDKKLEYDKQLSEKLGIPIPYLDKKQEAKPQLASKADEKKKPKLVGLPPSQERKENNTIKHPPQKTTATVESQKLEIASKKCPFCNHFNKYKAKICEKCQFDFDEYMPEYRIKPEEKKGFLSSLFGTKENDH